MVTCSPARYHCDTAARTAIYKDVLHVGIFILNTCGELHPKLIYIEPKLSEVLTSFTVVSSPSFWTQAVIRVDLIHTNTLRLTGATFTFVHN